MDAEKSYDDYWESGLHQVPAWSKEKFERWFAPLMNNDRILDYGCGMGYSLQKELVANNKEYVGADISAVALEDLKRKGLRGLKIGTDARIDVPDGYFDAAICCEVMEHLWDPLAAAKELARVVKPGGVLISTTPNYGYLPWRLLALFQGEVWSEPEDASVDPFKGVHIRYFSKRNFEKLHRMAGFSDVKIGRFDEADIFHFFISLNMQRLSGYLSTKLPAACRMSWLQNLSTSLMALRLRAVCIR